jgi:hypothetical protein
MVRFFSLFLNVVATCKGVGSLKLPTHYFFFLLLLLPKRGGGAGGSVELPKFFFVIIFLRGLKSEELQSPHSFFSFFFFPYL